MMIKTKISITLTSLLFLGACAMVAAQPIKRPNIVFILVDDLRWTRSALRAIHSSRRPTLTASLAKVCASETPS